MNYVKEVNAFWDDAPYMDGFKSDYGFLYLALVDAVNRNFWRETEIEYDRLMNKTRLSKRMYLDARSWLLANGFIHFTPGKNEYAKAKFNIVVRNCTSTDTATDTAGDTATDTATDTAANTTTDTATVPSTAPSIYKTINNRTINKEEEEARDFSSPTPIEVLVEDFKNLKKGDPPELRGTPLTLDDYEQLLLENRALLETTCMSLKISEADFERAVRKFIADKKAKKHQAKDESDITQHFMNWSRNRLWEDKDEGKQKGKLSKSLNTTVAAAEAIQRKGGLVTYADLQDQ